MDKEAGNAPRACIHVLVVTPSSHIHIPIMKMQLNIASCMGQVKTNIAALKSERMLHMILTTIKIAQNL